MARKKHKVLVTNPVSTGEADVLRKAITCYIIVPVEEDLFEIYLGKTYLGESSSLKQAQEFINRGGDDAPVLIKNPSGGYEVYKYKSPSKSNPGKKCNPKKRRKKRKTKKKTAKRKVKRKVKRKKKATKRKAKRKVKRQSGK